MVLEFEFLGNFAGSADWGVALRDVKSYGFLICGFLPRGMQIFRGMDYFVEIVDWGGAAKIGLSFSHVKVVLFREGDDGIRDFPCVRVRFVTKNCGFLYYDDP